MEEQPQPQRRATDENPLPTEDYLKAIANRILYARSYTYLYVALFLFQTALMIYGIVNYVALQNLNAYDVWFVICDVIVTIMLSAEVGLRYVATQDRYCESYLNMVDMLVAVICIAALFFYFLDPQTAIYGSAVLAIRYLAQLIRLALVLRNHNARRKIMSAMESDVDFSQLDSAEERDARNLFHGIGEEEEAQMSPAAKI